MKVFPSGIVVKCPRCNEKIFDEGGHYSSSLSGTYTQRCGCGEKIGRVMKQRQP